VERERKITAFVPELYYKVIADFYTAQQEEETKEFKAELTERLNSEEDARHFLNECIGSTFTVDNLDIKPVKKSPTPPFTTSTLQQDASRKLGFSVSQTMVVAQKLYEAGKITYMRTDSVSLSDTALEAAKEEIIKSYGNEYYNYRTFQTKSKGAQEAHEAIRPTYMSNHSVTGDNSEQRLYELIWKRKQW